MHLKQLLVYLLPHRFLHQLNINLKPILLNLNQLFINVFETN